MSLICCPLGSLQLTYITLGTRWAVRWSRLRLNENSSWSHKFSTKSAIFSMAWRSTGKTNVQLISNLKRNGIFHSDRVMEVSPLSLSFKAVVWWKLTTFGRRLWVEWIGHTMCSINWMHTRMPLSCVSDQVAVSSYALHCIAECNDRLRGIVLK